MSRYTDAEIAKIINDCEILILPDDVSIEDVGTDSKSLEIKEKIQKHNPKSLILNRYLNEQNLEQSSSRLPVEENFEEIFYQTKLRKANLNIPLPEDFSDYFNSYTNINDDGHPNPQKALAINMKLRHHMQIFRQKLERLIERINDRQRVLNIFLDEVKSNTFKDAISFKTTYIKCGAPFFKDALGYPAPENDDFKYRKDINKEFFPFDIPYSNLRWKTTEKVNLVRGIKNQMVDFLKLQQSRKVCQEIPKTRAKLQKLRYISSNQDLQQTSILNLYETIQNEHPNFVINWNLISFNDLQSTHSVAECMGMWYSYLRPDINREPFTDEENAMIAHAVVENKYENWQDISQYLNKRTPLQAFTYFYSEFSRLCPPNIRWTPEEDAQLMEAIKKNTFAGVISWNKVGLAISRRNKTQCYNRYIIMTKHQNVKRGVFSPHENRILLNYVAHNGTNFNQMPKDLLPNRSITQIKNHYNVALQHKGKVNPWTYEEDTKLMDFITEEGTNSWSKISGILQTHNRLSCRTRYLTITKFLNKNPDKNLKDVPSRLKTITAIHHAIQSDSENENEDSNAPDKFIRSKSFGLLTFEEFKIKNPLLHHLMKTNYNYKLDASNFEIDSTKFIVLQKLLRVSDSVMSRKIPSLLFTPNQMANLQEAFKFEIGCKLVQQLDFVNAHTQFLLPPNYNTAVGLRAIAIKVQQEPISKEVKDPANPSDEYKAYLESFQKLFFSLFYWTAMASKIRQSEMREIVTATHPEKRVCSRLPKKRRASHKVYSAAKKANLSKK